VCLSVCLCDGERDLTVHHTVTHMNKSYHTHQSAVSNMLHFPETHNDTMRPFTMKAFTLRHIFHTATHCNTLQHTATHCNTLQHTATHCNTLQYAATRSNTLQHTDKMSFLKRSFVLPLTHAATNRQIHIYACKQA